MEKRYDDIPDKEFVMPTDKIDEDTRVLANDVYTLGAYNRAKMQYLYDKQARNTVPNGAVDLSHSIDYLENPIDVFPSMKQTTEYWLMHERQSPQLPVYFAAQGYDYKDFVSQIKAVPMPPWPMKAMLGDGTTLTSCQAVYWVDISSHRLVKRSEALAAMTTQYESVLNAATSVSRPLKRRAPVKAEDTDSDSPVMSVDDSDNEVMCSLPVGEAPAVNPASSSGGARRCHDVD
jgi:hypothetical protein